MLRDVEYLESRISKLDGAADLGEYLVKLVNDKTVAERAGPSDTTSPGEDGLIEKQPESANGNDT